MLTSQDEMIIMLGLTDLCYNLKIAHNRDPHYCRGEGIHQLISEDELLSRDETQDSIVPQMAYYDLLFSSPRPVDH